MIALIAAVAVVALTACAPEIRPAADVARQPPDFPAAEYRRAAAEGRAVYRIDPARSIVTIEVRRAGSLARLGHDHVIASHDVRGYLLPDTGRSDLYVRLEGLVVDEADLRAEAGFSTQPSAEDIAGTRRNMLKAFEVERFPFARVRVSRVDREGNAAMAETSIALHGATRAFRVPVNVDTQRDAVEISGGLALAQTDFGIVPLSILGGAIQVEDRVGLRFRIHADREEARVQD